MFLAAVTPLTDRSGVNLRSVVSLNKTEYDEDAGSAPVGDASRTCLVFLIPDDPALWELNINCPEHACLSFPPCHTIRGFSDVEPVNYTRSTAHSGWLVGWLVEWGFLAIYILFSPKS
jgi:hypothetical protein